MFVAGVVGPAVALASLTLAARTAEAQEGTPAFLGSDRDAHFLGNAAAMTGGSGAALTHDGEAIWYNPAGLGAVSRSSLDLSGSAFTLRSREVEGVLVVDVGDQVARLNASSLDFASVPSAITLVRHLMPNVTLGLGVFVPVQDKYEFDDAIRLADVFSDSTPRIDYQERQLLAVEEREIHVGMAMGWQPHPQLRLGGAVMVVYATSTLRSEYWLHAFDPASEGKTDFADLESVRVDSQGVGVQPVFGLQWQPTEELHMGLTVRGPLMLFHSEHDFIITSAISSLDADNPSNNSAESFFVQAEEPLQGFEVVRSGRIHLSFAWEFEPRAWLGAEVDVRLPLKNTHVGLELVTAVNARIGAVFPLSDTFTMGVGLFTDLSSAAAVDEFGDLRTDWLGLAFGFERRSVHPLSDDPESSITISSTVGFRYGLGIAEFGALEARGQSFELTEQIVVRKALFHEAALHIGSALHF